MTGTEVGAVGAPRRSTTVARLGVLVGYVFRACLPGRRLATIALPVLAIAGSGLLARTLDKAADAAFAEVAGVAIFGLAMPLGALVIGDAVLGAEVRAGTFAFSWLSPARFWELTLSRWLGGWAIACLTLVPAAALAAVTAGAGGLAGPVALGAATGAGAHVALFVLVGCVTRRTAAWSLGIVFLVERLLGSVLLSIAALSPTWLGLYVFWGIGGEFDAELRDGMPLGWGAVARLAVLAVVFLGLATVRMARVQLTGPRD